MKKVNINALLKVFLFLTILLNSYFLIHTSAHASILSRAPNNLGLVGYWPMNEGVGTQAGDFSGNNNNASFYSSPVWAPGKFGTSLYFNGSNYISTAGVTIPAGSSITISFWNNVSTLSSDSAFSIGNQDVPNRIQAHVPWSDGNVYWDYGDYSSRLSANYSNYVGKWTLVTLEFDANTNTHAIYFNGVLANSTINSNSPIVSETGLTIGAFTGYYHTGSIDDFRVYNRALSATDVANLYKAGLVKVNASSADLTAGTSLANGLVGLWTMDNGDISGTTMSDRSGQGNGGIINGSPPATIGKLGQGLNVNGLTQYINLNTPTSLNLVGQTNAITISAWVKTTPSGDTQFIVSKDGCGVAGQFDLLVSSDGYIQGMVGQAVSIAKGNTYVTDGNWHLLTMTAPAASSGLKLYVDSKLQIFNTGNGSVFNDTNNRDVLIGASRCNDNTDIGSPGDAAAVDDVRIYNRELSVSEIQQLYNLSAGKINSSQNVTHGSLDSGLVGLWSFNGADLSGNTVYDRSGNGYDGIIDNTPHPVVGKLGQALAFGDSNSVQVGSHTQLSPSNITVSFWVKMNQDTPDSFDGFLGSTNTFVWSNGWLVYYDGGNTRVSFAIEGYNVNRANFDTTNLNWRQWNHIVGTWDGSTIRIYVNGVEGTPASYSGSLTNSNPMTIGEAGSAPTLPGEMDEVRVYNRVLSANEIKQLYNMGE